METFVYWVCAVIGAVFVFVVLRVSYKDSDITYYNENVRPVFHFDEIAKSKKYFKKTYGSDFFEWHTYEAWVKSGRKKRHR